MGWDGEGCDGKVVYGGDAGRIMLETKLKMDSGGREEMLCPPNEAGGKLLTNHDLI